MQKKLTITVDQDVYDGLHKVIGRRKISKFIENLARPYVILHSYESAYAEMAKDEENAKTALEWSEIFFDDESNETG